MSTNKQEIIRQVNEMIAQLKSGTYKSPFSQVFADVVIEDGRPDKKDEYAGEEIRPKSAAVPNRPHDPQRDMFNRMKEITREIYRSPVLGDNYRERVFYKQARFMADFEDDYQGTAQFQMYFPTYQMMSYEQLRTYFTWRSRVRAGDILKTDLSYVFLYIYELINNIGVSDGEDGISKLMHFWNSYRRYTLKLDKYMAAWVRDYYVLNSCRFTFRELVLKEPVLQEYYPVNKDNNLLDFYSRISAYNIKESIFCTPENEKMLVECFEHIIERLNILMGKANRKFSYLVFDRSVEKRWQPFQNALFYMRPVHLPHNSKTVEITEDCVYRYRNGKWVYTSGNQFSSNGRQVVGYILKRMEQLLRRAEKFKYKLTADDKKIDKRHLDKLLPGIGSKGFIAEIDLAVKEYYISSKRTVVKVDESRLMKIRENALLTQEKLIVSEADELYEEPPGDSCIDDEIDTSESEPFKQEQMPHAAVSEDCFAEDEAGAEPEAAGEPRNTANMNMWDAFVGSLEPVELTALINMLEGVSVKKLQELVKGSGCMLEVLLDGINQKALDFTSDTILELSDEITIYEDYTENLRKAVGCE